ncbi:MAG: hypothetical protein H7Z74_13435 [Anaerolineae bacterium]|nr:hypothetical protein [Gemmatimonadaceae bacterium]
MQHRRFLTFALVLIAFGVGCKRPKPDMDQAPQEFTDIPLEVENRSFLDVTVYLLQQGNRQRLGMASGASTTTVMIRKQFLIGYSGELRFIADPVGSPNTIVSDAISIRPGEHIHWTLDKIGSAGIQSNIAVVQ